MRDINLADEQLQATLAARGPFVSLYLNTEVANQNAPREIHLRWRGLREQAESLGASSRAMEAIDELVDDSHQSGKGLVVVTAADEVVYRRHLGARPVDDFVRVEALPHLLPLIEWRQENPSHGVLLAYGGGAEIYAGAGEALDQGVSVKGSAGDHVERTASGGSEANLQHRAEHLAEENAQEVAAELARVVSSHGLEVVLVAGEEQALSVLRKHLPESLSDNLVDVGDHAHRGASLEGLREPLDLGLAGYAAGTTQEVVGTFLEEREQGDQAAETAGRTIDALRKAQVDTLLIARKPDDRRAWFSTQEPTQAAMDKSVLADLGLAGISEGPLSDVLVRSAYATGAKVRVIPELARELGPAEGIGAILRYA